MDILQVNSTVNGYKIVKILGRDQMGVTYLGQKQVYEPVSSRTITKKFSIKAVDLEKVSQLGLNPETVEAETKFLTQISIKPTCDQYMACYYNHFTITGQDNTEYLFIVTDYIIGKSLQTIILEQTDHGNFEMSRLLQMMVDIAQAVDYIHQRGVVHQNLKPSNIIYDSNTQRLKLVDFSLSCSQRLNKLCKGKVGTAYYMPPELLALQDPAEQPFSFRAAHDIWSVGVIFYQMANLGKKFMDLTSTNPKLIAKEIQTGSVNPSKYPYDPINSVINTILNKDYTGRPTAGQLLILLELARPLCIVNNQPFDRLMALSLLDALGFDINPNINDKELCMKLTDSLAVCKINDHKYQKEHLLRLAKILNIKVDNSTPGTALCDILQKALQSNHDAYSQRVTQLLLRTLEYIAFINARVRGNNKTLQPLLEKLEIYYTNVYTEAKKLDLINIKVLETRRDEMMRKSAVYKQDTSLAYSRIYKHLATQISAVIANNKQLSGLNIGSSQLI